jgi:hypothetical protein
LVKRQRKRVAEQVKRQRKRVAEQQQALEAVLASHILRDLGAYKT